jgi:hypothetical protein
MADYAISNVARRVVYTNTGVGPYSFTFEVLANTDIAVYRGSTLLTLTTDYTVIINANGTGSVTLVVAGTGNITIVGSRAIQRTSDYTTGGDLFASTLNTDLDSQTIYVQQVAETAERGLKAPVVDPTDINMTLPAKASRVGTVLAFNATTGNPEAGPSIGSVTTVAAQSANINTVATNIASVNTVAGNNSNVTIVAGISGNITTVAGISSNVTSVAGNSTNINTVAGISGNVTTVAGVSASVSTVAGISANVTTVAGISANVTTVAGVSTNVTTVATNIASVNTNATNIVAIQNASTNATNAANSATAAQSAQTAAESARDSALAAYDNFDDRYLGSKTSNPTLDNDGNALVAGALYFNSVSGAMQVYTGSAWVAAYVSGTGFLATANNLSDLASFPTARTNLGLGSIATQAASSVSITGGSITGITDLAVEDGGTGASTLTGVLKGNGTSAFTAATAGTDYVAPGGALGTPSSGTLSSCTVDGTDAVGFRNVPQNAQTGNYTLVLADSGKHIFHASGAGAATYTIPANSSVAYAIGTAITFINLSTTSISIEITTDTMYLSSAGTTGNRTLAQYGSATAIKITSTNWIISGSGLT